MKDNLLVNLVLNHLLILLLFPLLKTVTIPPPLVRFFPIIIRFLVILVKDLKAISFALIVEKLIILLRHVFSSTDLLLDIETAVKEVLQISNLLLAWLK